MTIAEGEPLRYQDVAAYAVRAGILEARGELAAAAADQEIAVRLARENDEAQSLWPTLVAAAWLARRHARRDEATALLDEVVQAIAASESAGDPQEWQIALAVELVIADRDDEATEIAGRLPEGRWRDACLAAAERRFEAAAEDMAAIGERVLEADLRLLAARALAAQGRLAEAEEQLGRARAFWRRVGATAYLREAEDVLVAAS
jgi:hypothetical protein